MQRFGLSYLRRIAAVCAAAVCFCGQPASAFYWDGWPGSGLPPLPQLTIKPKPTPELHYSEITIPKVVPNPSVPEPGTLIAAAVGLATVGLRAIRRRKRGALPHLSEPEA